MTASGACFGFFCAQKAVRFAHPNEGKSFVYNKSLSSFRQNSIFFQFPRFLPSFWFRLPFSFPPLGAQLIGLAALAPRPPQRRARQLAGRCFNYSRLPRAGPNVKRKVRGTKSRRLPQWSGLTPVYHTNWLWFIIESTEVTYAAQSPPTRIHP